MIYILFIVLLIISFFVYHIYKKYYDNKKLTKFKDMGNILPRPFVSVKDDKNNKINCVLVSHPFTRQTGEDGTYEQYVQWKNEGVHFVGITSFSEFPGYLTNPYDTMNDRNDICWKNHDYMKYFDIWLNCFKDPYKHIDSDKKIALISESDFIDTNIFKPNILKKEYDFMYICNKDHDDCESGWNYYIRNWELGKQCIDIMCRKYGMKGIVIGRSHCKLLNDYGNLCIMKEFMSQKELIKTYQQTKCLLLPNTVDASPRILTEALSCDCRCLVNKEILGGWKYVNENTGEFFTNKEDFETSMIKIFNNYNEYNPSEYFNNNYGKINSGKRLKKFLCDNIPELNVINSDYFTL